MCACVGACVCVCVWLWEFCPMLGSYQSQWYSPHRSRPRSLRCSSLRGRMSTAGKPRATLRQNGSVSRISDQRSKRQTTNLIYRGGVVDRTQDQDKSAKITDTTLQSRELQENAEFRGLVRASPLDARSRHPRRCVLPLGDVGYGRLRGHGDVEWLEGLSKRTQT